MKNIIRQSWILLLLVLLSGCGVLKIDIDYGGPPVPAYSETAPSSVIAPHTPTPPVTLRSTSAPDGADSNPSPAAAGFVDLAAGRDFTCAVLDAGTVYCWGNNTHGQLGNGTRVNSNIPVRVDAITDAKAVTAGWGHACALLASGGVKCWGYNADGELGQGTFVDRTRPVVVSGLEAGAIAVDAGDFHTCAATVSNGLKCWGKNTYGQLGDWTKTDRALPVDSPFFGGGVADVAAGRGHTCVQTTLGWAKCWGNNAFGQMGFGKLTDIHLPAEDVVNLNGRVLKIAADGNQTCALIAGGGAQCWGDDRYGQLGDGAVEKRYEPVPVTGLTSGVIDIEAGWNHACAVVSGGELRCWGWNFYGQLGEGTTVNRNIPARVQYLTDGAAGIAIGWGHTCVVTGLGAVKCWGFNGSGQLGDGTWIDSKVPLTVIRLEPATSPTPSITSTLTDTCTAAFSAQ
jgi:alpha-tubulin suppressor-like RCC1 family protein